MFWTGSQGLSTPRSAAVPGINCIRPIAPLFERARGLNARFHLDDGPHQVWTHAVRGRRRLDDLVVQAHDVRGDRACRPDGGVPHRVGAHRPGHGRVGEDDGAGLVAADVDLCGDRGDRQAQHQDRRRDEETNHAFHAGMAPQDSIPTAGPGISATSAGRIAESATRTCAWRRCADNPVSRPSAPGRRSRHRALRPGARRSARASCRPLRRSRGARLHRHRRSAPVASRGRRP